MNSMPMTTEEEIATILSSKYVPKVGKYIVKLSFEGSKAKEVWMSEKQLLKLEFAFSKTEHGYSSKRLKIIGVWKDGYYAWCRCEYQKREFVLPTQYDLSDLRDDE